MMHWGLFSRTAVLAAGIFWATALSVPLRAELRTWTSANGAKTFEAQYINSTESMVRLRTKGGKTINSPLDKFSRSDQEFAKLARKFAKSPRWPMRIAAPDGLANARFDRKGNDRIGAHFVYTSRNFEFKIYSHNQLQGKLMEYIARLFEGTRELLVNSPWQLEIATPEGGFKAELFATREAYEAAGGPKLSGGVYLMNERKFLVPFESLNIERNGNKFDLKPGRFDSSALVHELTHMMMHDLIPMLPMFLIEGTAEYARVIPFENAVFDCDDVKRASGIKAVNERYFKIFSGWADFPGIQDFELLLEMSPEEWQKKSMIMGGPRLTSAKEFPVMQASLYQSSLLLTHYFMDLDEEGYLDLGDKGNLKGFGLLELLHYSQEDMKFVLKKGQAPVPFGFDFQKFKDGRNNRKPGLHRIDLLLSGRTPKEVADDARAKLKEAGFQLE